jgi:AmmeMemoRadiSam system protein A
LFISTAPTITFVLDPHIGEDLWMDSQLSEEERHLLLQIARKALEACVCNQPLPRLQWDSLPASFRDPGATFVTLTKHGQLRGCIGALEAYQFLAEDVREHTQAAALEDYRFPPVLPDELSQITIEISRLTAPQPLEYTHPQDLVAKLRPGIDGVVLRDGFRRATFLPQVWEKLADPELFLSHLCQKMGVSPMAWRRKKLEVLVYQVEEFHE